MTIPNGPGYDSCISARKKRPGRSGKVLPGLYLVNLAAARLVDELAFRACETMPTVLRDASVTVTVFL